MQIKNKIYMSRYLIGTCLNIVWPLILMGLKDFIYVYVIFILGIIVNQYFLLIVAADLIGLESNKSIIPTPIMAILKLIILVAVFYVAITSSVNNEAIFIIFYIVQLVVFGVSLRLDIKK